MKKPVLIFLLSFLALWAVAQQQQDGDINTQDLPTLSGATTKTKPAFNMSVGTSFMFMPKYGSALSHYAAPQMTFFVSPKFRINTGFMFQYTSLNTLGDHGETGSLLFVQPQFQTLGFVAGEYDVNEKLTLTGRVFGGYASMQLPGTDPKHYNYMTYGAAGGFEYKISDHASFRAEVQIVHQPNPYRVGRPGSNLDTGTFNRIGPWDMNW